MKGFLSRLGGPPAASSASDSDSGGFAGRQFSLSRHQVVVEEKLAEGGFALVFRVRSQLDGRVYALKRMCVNDEQAMQVCMLEVSLVRSITHKNVVRYVDHAVHQLPNGVREILLLMVYYRRSLSDLLNRCAQSGRQLPDQQVLRIFADICSAVAQLHLRRPPVQHRDLKAENVLAASDDPDCAFVLCDFGSASERPLQTSAMGVARVEEEIKKYTTLSYRSPEMINLYSGLPIDTKSDIWALGCLLYRLAYLGLPFGESSLAISSAKLCLPDSPARPTGLRRLIGYALRPEPGDRPDIRQLSGLACRLAGRQCDIPAGTESAELPQLDSLPLPPSESEVREASALRKSPSSSQLQSQPNQLQPVGVARASSVSLKPAAGSTAPSCARQRPRPGNAGLQTPPLPPPQQQQPPPHHPTVDLLSVGGANPLIRHRRLVSDTSALMLRPPTAGPASSASPLFGNPAQPAADWQTRQRVVSLEKLSTPATAPPTDLLVDLDAPSSTDASGGVSAHRNSSASGWAADAGLFATPSPAAAPLEDSAFGDECLGAKAAAASNTDSIIVSASTTASTSAAAVKPAVMTSYGAHAASRPMAMRPPVMNASGWPPPQQQQQQQHWSGPSPKHPSQLMNQQVFWPN
uniref:non-specific serine/threonine protein kinase n=1 Tax=Macrostomum lignano TaxID=282301 RepID=A0A1I8G0S0_9PLAT